MRRPRSRRAGDDEERRQTGFLPDFRDAIKAARGPRESDRVKRAAKGKAEFGVILFESRSAYVARQTAVSSTSVNALTRGRRCPDASAMIGLYQPALDRLPGAAGAVFGKIAGTSGMPGSERHEPRNI
jgi:hypothetical protein